MNKVKVVIQVQYGENYRPDTDLVTTEVHGLFPGDILAIAAELVAVFREHGEAVDRRVKTEQAKG